MSMVLKALSKSATKASLSPAPQVCKQARSGYLVQKGKKGGAERCSDIVTPQHAFSRAVMENEKTNMMLEALASKLNEKVHAHQLSAETNTKPEE